MTEPCVSILIPCHNAEPWIAATIESALAQTWPNTEVIVVDDGSTDDSAAIASRSIDCGVRVVMQSNRGASAARNAGLAQARGDFIQFLDADDLLSPNKIAAQISSLANHPANSVASCAWGRFAGDPAQARFIDAAVFRDFSPMDFLVLAGTTGAMMHPAAWLVPRTVADRAGRWNESLSLNDDGEYFCRALLASTGIAFCDEARTYYRSAQTGSLSQRRHETARRSQFKSIELCEQHMLAAENSARTRRAVANQYQRFIYDFFPRSPELLRKAANRIARLGGSSQLKPAMGPRTAALARWLGWKNVWRLKQLAHR